MEHVHLNLNVMQVEDDAGIRVTRVLRLPLSGRRRKIEEGLLFLQSSGRCSSGEADFGESS